MKVDVQCYSGSSANEKPISFIVEGHEYFVEEVLDQWKGPEAQYFRLMADDGGVYILKLQANGEEDEWSLAACRRPFSAASGA